jgi:hypothetical protein
MVQTPLRLVAAALVALALLGAPRAAAEATVPKHDRAAELAEVGRIAHGMGKYAAAIQAYEQAYRATLDDELLFALGESHRQRFAVRGLPENLRQAVAYHRLYLRTAPGGSHRAAAERAIAALEPELSRRGLQAGDIEPGADDTTRLAVTSATLGAVVRVDGGRAFKLPAFFELRPGKHRLRVSAPGHRTRVRKIDVPRAKLHSARVALQQRPALLDIDGPSGAQVYVDGKLVGTTPLETPVAVEPGRHVVAVAASGHHPWEREVRLARGKKRTLPVELEATDQRTAAWALMSVGGVSLAAGIAFGVVSVIALRDSRTFLDETGGGELDDEEEEAYDEIVARRDNFRIASGIGVGVGLGLFAIGGALFILDEPNVPSRGAPDDVTVSVTPIAGPDGGGATFTLGF